VACRRSTAACGLARTIRISRIGGAAEKGWRRNAGIMLTVLTPSCYKKPRREEGSPNALGILLVRTPSSTGPHQPRSMTIRPNGGIRMVTSPSTTHPDACLSALSGKQMQQAKTTWQLRRFVGSTTSGMGKREEAASENSLADVYEGKLNKWYQ